MHSSVRTGISGLLLTLCVSGMSAQLAIPASSVDAQAKGKASVVAERGGSGSSRPAESTSYPRAVEYAIGPGDVLSIQVWKEPDLSRSMPVRPDGRISLPVLGEMQASGLTALQLQDRIGDRLQAFVRNPQVNVTVEQIKSRTFNVVGKVAKAGSFELLKPTTVLDAIALAGGFQDFARVTKIYVLRRSATGKEAMLRFNYKRVIKGQHPEQNVTLEPNDTVVVP